MNISVPEPYVQLAQQIVGGAVYEVDEHNMQVTLTTRYYGDGDGDEVRTVHKLENFDRGLLAIALFAEYARRWWAQCGPEEPGAMMYGTVHERASERRTTINRP